MRTFLILLGAIFCIVGLCLESHDIVWLERALLGSTVVGGLLIIAAIAWPPGIFHAIARGITRLGYD